MTATTAQESFGADVINVRHHVGIFLLSMAALLLELSLTRVLSVTMLHRFGFLVISTALLGFGESGVVLTIWRKLAGNVYAREGFPVTAPVTAMGIPGDRRGQDFLLNP